MNDPLMFLFIGGSRDGETLHISHPANVVYVPASTHNAVTYSDEDAKPDKPQHNEASVKKHIEIIQRVESNPFTPFVPCPPIVALDYYLHAELADLNGIQTLIEQAVNVALASP